MGAILKGAAYFALTLLLAMVGGVSAQPDADFNQALVESYDLLEAGKLDQARALLERLAQKDPGNPLVLNNLGAIMVKQKKYQDAVWCLEQALPRARGYKVKVNRVCDLGGMCLAYRPLLDAYGDQDLEPLIRLNLDLIKAQMGADKQ
jgi:tetratricopeptide (TPR) repeat protein